MKRNCFGFSLIELLAVLLIIGIVGGIVGIFAVGIINNSDDKADLLVKNSVKQTAGIYVKEYVDDVVWMENEDNKTSYACVPVLTLVNKGYFTKEEVAGVSDYIILTRNVDKSIIKAEEEQSGICSNFGLKKIEIPTAKKYCNNNLIYSPDTTVDDLLVNIGAYGESVSFSNNTDKINAGSYLIEAILNDKSKYVWSDDTSDKKVFICSIKKATPYFDLSSTGDAGIVGETDIILTLSKPVAGVISLKSSNKEFATARVKDFDSVKGVATITIKKLATRKANTYITITFTPDDKNNYYSYSRVYTIGGVEKKVVDGSALTVDDICLNPNYNGSYQFITKPVDLDAGYEIYNNYYKEIGNNYKVIVKLKYGSVWKDVEDDKKYEDKEFTCSILRPNVVVTYDDNGGTSCDKVKASAIPYEGLYGNPPCTPQRVGYTQLGWYTATSGGTKVESTTQITNWLDHTLYAQWKINQHTLSYDSNGGSSCSSVVLNYGDAYGTLCEPTKEGHDFKGWYKDSAKVSSSTKIYSDVKLVAQWEIRKYKFDVNLDTGISTFKITVGSNAKSGALSDYWEDNNYGTNFLISDIVVKTGYSYAGNELGGQSNYFNNSNMDSSNIYITMGDGASFVKLKANPKNYTLKYDSNGGSTCNSKTITYDAAYGDLCSTTKAGYTFLGWYDAETGGNQVTSSTITTGDATVYAYWRENVWYVSNPAQYQDTLKNALKVANANATLTLQKDVTDDSATSVSKNVTIDLGTFTLSRTKTLAFGSGVKATLKGSGKMKNNTNVNYLVKNSGLLTINNLTFSGSSGTADSNPAIILNLGQMEINSANVSSDKRPAIQTGAYSDHLHGLTWIKDCIISATNWHAIRNFSVARWPIESEYNSSKHLHHCSQKCAVHIEGTTKISQPDSSNDTWYPVMNEYGKIHMPKAYAGWIYSKSYYTLRSASVHTFDADFSLYDVSIYKKKEKSTGTIKMNGGTLYAKNKKLYKNSSCDSFCKPGIIELNEDTSDKDGYVKKETGAPT